MFRGSSLSDLNTRTWNFDAFIIEVELMDPWMKKFLVYDMKNIYTKEHDFKYRHPLEEVNISEVGSSSISSHHHQKLYCPHKPSVAEQWTQHYHLLVLYLELHSSTDKVLAACMTKAFFCNFWSSKLGLANLFYDSGMTWLNICAI